MGEQRRRGGRGRSGRGGRIPRKGEAGAGGGSALDESFVSFPLEGSGAIAVASPLDEQAVERALGRTLDRERRQAQALRALADRFQDPVLSEIGTQVERHRDMLQQLARDLGAEFSGNGQPEPGSGDVQQIAAEQYLSRLEWTALHRLAHAAGDRRIDRVVTSVLRDKERHSEVLEELALRDASRALFRELD